MLSPSFAGSRMFGRASEKGARGARPLFPETEPPRPPPPRGGPGKLLGSPVPDSQLVYIKCSVCLGMHLYFLLASHSLANFKTDQLLHPPSPLLAAPGSPPPPFLQSVMDQHGAEWSIGLRTGQNSVSGQRPTFVLENTGESACLALHRQALPLLCGGTPTLPLTYYPAPSTSQLDSCARTIFSRATSWRCAPTVPASSCARIWASTPSPPPRLRHPLTRRRQGQQGRKARAAPVSLSQEHLRCSGRPWYQEDQGVLCRISLSFH